jgi:hypothetical protein
MSKITLEINKEELKNQRGLTVGELKEFIEKYNIPDDAPVVTQRVEDHYYENNHWGVYCKEGYHCWMMRGYNRKIDSGEYNNKEEYPDMTEEFQRKLYSTEEQIKEANEQYSRAWSCVYYKEDSDILFIDLHY